ncbi:hypothetical protein ACLBW0_11100 [Enterobacteriaceae bacterium C34A]
MKKYIVLMLVTLLAGCSHYEWVKPGSTNQQREVEETACNADALKNLPPDNVVSSTHRSKENKKKDGKHSSSDEDVNYYTHDANADSRDVLIKNCMFQKGWTQIEVDQ